MLLLVCAAILAGCRSSPVETSTVAIPPAGTSLEPDVELPYQDPDLPVEDRVEDLVARMTLEEKVGQMTLVEKNSILAEDISGKFIGALLSGGGGYPTPNTPHEWLAMVNRFQEHALGTRLGIPIIYGVDAVHGHAAVEGAVVFPHNIGLGATRDLELVERIGRATALEMAATNIYWNFGPVVAVPQDIRWGRTYEGYSEDTELVSQMAMAYIRGLQNRDGRPNLRHSDTVLATPKHYVADGGTVWGSSSTFIFKQYMLDQGVAEVDEATLRAVHLDPYTAAVDAGALSIMVSFSSWGDLKMHAHKYLLTDVLKGELGFEGFLVSDWGGIDQIPGTYYDDIVTSINAGLDMIMVPYDYDAFIAGLTRAVEEGDVPLDRIDDAVRRILNVKFQLGLFERPFGDEALLPVVGSDAHRELAREAVRKSLVLLKNADGTLPLAKDAPLILVAGQAADDMGIQCGGWTIEWQGQSGNITPGTTILEAIQNTVSENTAVRYSPSGQFERPIDGRADVGIVVVGEMPYAEGVGDQEDLTLSEADITLIENVGERSKKTVVILVSGRPMIVTTALDQWDALVAAWLPGTEGQGVADVLFGDYAFTGKLPYTWPRWMNQLPYDLKDIPTTGCEAPLFPIGYGLDAESAEALELLDCPGP